jgi:molybdopterin synthase sulfur carrier subunit
VANDVLFRQGYPKTNGTTTPPEGQPSTFKILYFASAWSFTGKEGEDLPAPLEVGRLYAFLESKYQGFRERVLRTCKVSVNWEYVDLEQDANQVIEAGDEVGILPPVSGG